MAGTGVSVAWPDTRGLSSGSEDSQDWGRGHPEGLVPHTLLVLGQGPQQAGPRPTPRWGGVSGLVTSGLADRSLRAAAVSQAGGRQRPAAKQREARLIYLKRKEK